MGNFKKFLLSEEIGLGNLGSRLNAAFDHIDEKIGGAFLSSDVSSTEQSETQGFAGHPLYLPSTDLTVPQNIKTGRIQTLLLKKNPIYIKLSNGTEAYFTFDEYRRIQGTPAIGKVMSIIFQRHPSDKSETVSKIDKAIVRD